ncbi:10675_t:CDS:1, partial [Acaulospora colombiana]
ENNKNNLKNSEVTNEQSNKNTEYINLTNLSDIQIQDIPLLTSKPINSPQQHNNPNSID